MFVESSGNYDLCLRKNNQKENEMKKKLEFRLFILS